MVARDCNPPDDYHATVAVEFHEDSGGVRFRVKVVPGSSRDRVVGALGNALKIAVSKPAHAGAANEAVKALLSEALGVARSSVHIVRGQGTPRKDLFVAGLSARDASARLGASGE